MFVLGLHHDADVQGLLEFVEENPMIQVYAPFFDLAMHWDAATRPSTGPAYDLAVLNRIHFSTNLPNPHADTDEYIHLLLEHARQEGRNYTTPLEAAGYFTHMALNFHLEQLGLKARGHDVLKSWYHSATTPMGSATLGPFYAAGGEIHDACSMGVRALPSYRLGDYLQGKRPICHMQFTSCALDYSPPPSWGPGIVALMIVAPVLLLTIAAQGCWRYRRQRMRLAVAPQDPAQPFSAMFVTLLHEADFWELYPTQMKKIHATYSSLVEAAVHKTKCYRVKKVGNSTLIVAKHSESLLQCAERIQTEVASTDWDALADVKATKYVKNKAHSSDESDQEDQSDISTTSPVQRYEN